jgi:hypothetical protein
MGDLIITIIIISVSIVGEISSYYGMASKIKIFVLFDRIEGLPSFHT